MKKCPKCKQYKEFNGSYCKSCKAEYMKNYFDKKPEIRLESVLKWQKTHPEKVIERNKKWLDKNLDYMEEYHRKYSIEYNNKNREQINIAQRKWREKNPEWHHKYYLENKDKNSEKNRIRKKKARQNPKVKIAENIRNRLNYALNGAKKLGSAVRDLGCSIEELKQHLESKFYPNPETSEQMTWDNYGIYGWHIDHIKPLISFDLMDIGQFLKACHYTNLQPMWAGENLRKSDKF